MKITKKVLKLRANDDLSCNTLLNLSNLGIGELEKLSCCPCLESLDISNNCIEEIDGIECCRQLWNINCNNNKICSLSGFIYFCAFGKVDLSNNNLSWESLARIQNIVILDLRLYGNPELEKDPYYRIHVIDCLPNVWMLDGILITSSERLQVQHFYEKSALSTRPVRRKLTQRPFTSRRRYASAHGDRTIEVMKKFPIQETLSSATDFRRLLYLSQNLDCDCENTIDSTNEFKVFNILNYRNNEREKSNMLLLLLVSSHEFDLPPILTADTLSIAKLDQFAYVDTSQIFLFPRAVRIRVMSLLLSACKLDRDTHMEGTGLYDRLYLCLYYFVIEFIKSEANANHDKHQISLYRPRTASHESFRKSNSNTRFSPVIQQEHRRLLASEVVLLLSVVPSFYRYVETDNNVQSLLCCATGDDSICNRLLQISKDVEQEQGDISRIYVDISDHIAQQIENNAYTSFLHMEKKGQEESNMKSYLDSKQEWKIILDTPKAYPKRPKSAVLTVSEHLASGRPWKSKRERAKSAMKRPNIRLNLGDNVLLGPQNVARVIAIPDNYVALVQMNTVPTISGSVVINTNNSEDHYCYVDVKRLEYDTKLCCWKPHGAIGDKITMQRTTQNVVPDNFKHTPTSKSNNIAPTLPAPCNTSRKTGSPRGTGVFMITSDESEEDEVGEEDDENFVSPVEPQKLSLMFKEKMDLKLPMQANGSGLFSDSVYFLKEGFSTTDTSFALKKIQEKEDENSFSEFQEVVTAEGLKQPKAVNINVIEAVHETNLTKVENNFEQNNFALNLHEMHREKFDEIKESKPMVPIVNIRVGKASTEPDNNSSGNIRARRVKSARYPNQTKGTIPVITRPVSAMGALVQDNKNNLKRPDSASSFQLERTEAWRSSASTLSTVNVGVQNLITTNEVSSNPPPQRPTSPSPQTVRKSFNKNLSSSGVADKATPRSITPVKGPVTGIKSVDNWLAEGKDLHSDYKKSRVYLSPRLPGYIEDKMFKSNHSSNITFGNLLSASLPLTTTSLALHSLHPQKQAKRSTTATPTIRSKTPAGPTLSTKISTKSHFSHLNSIKKLHSKPHQSYTRRSAK